MTSRLYYKDAMLRVFEAQVLERQAVAGEDGTVRPAVRLDRTAFYPTSGGQPYDTGTLNGIAVVEVLEAEPPRDAAPMEGAPESLPGGIWHLLARSLPEDVTSVTGIIDWPRRFDHMQQHTGQHMLSAAFEDGLGAHTVGFHLGHDGSTIDLDIPDLSWEAAARIEREVNRVVWENRPVTVRTVSEDQLEEIPLRKPPMVTGEIRVIWVKDYDASACGGTHVRATGEIGIVKISGIERYKGGVRVGFLCGDRALKDYQQAADLLRVSSLALSVGAGELPEAIARLDDEVHALRRSVRQARSELVAYEAARLWDEAPAVAGVHVIATHWGDRDFDEVRGVANALRERPQTVALLAAADVSKGVRLVCACSDDLPEVDAATLLRSALAPLGGRGGGSPQMAQGGAPSHSAGEIEAAFRSALTQHGLDGRDILKEGGQL